MSVNRRQLLKLASVIDALYEDAMHSPVMKKQALEDVRAGYLTKVAKWIEDVHEQLKEEEEEREYRKTHGRPPPEPIESYKGGVGTDYDLDEQEFDKARALVARRHGGKTKNPFQIALEPDYMDREWRKLMWDKNPKRSTELDEHIPGEYDDEDEDEDDKAMERPRPWHYGMTIKRPIQDDD